MVKKVHHYLVYWGQFVYSSTNRFYCRAFHVTSLETKYSQIFTFQDSATVSKSLEVLTPILGQQVALTFMPETILDALSEYEMDLERLENDKSFPSGTFQHVICSQRTDDAPNTPIVATERIDGVNAKPLAITSRRMSREVAMLVNSLPKKRSYDTWKSLLACDLPHACIVCGAALRTTSIVCAKGGIRHRFDDHEYSCYEVFDMMFNSGFSKNTEGKSSQKLKRNRTRKAYLIDNIYTQLVNMDGKRARVTEEESPSTFNTGDVELDCCKSILYSFTHDVDEETLDSFKKHMDDLRLSFKEKPAEFILEALCYLSFSNSFYFFLDDSSTATFAIIDQELMRNGFDAFNPQLHSSVRYTTSNGSLVASYPTPSDSQ